MSEYEFRYGDQLLECVPYYKYLGVILDEHLKFERCVQTLADSGGRALGSIINKFKTLKNVGYRTFECMYNSGVKPILEYCCSVWGHVKGSSIDCIQNRAMRYYLGVHKMSPNLALNGDMGWLTPKLSRYKCKLRFWNRLMEMDENRITKQIFHWDFQYCKKNWSSDMLDVFTRLDSDAFICKEIYNLDTIDSKLKDLMLVEWKNEVVKKPKLRTYCLFKENVDTEDYVAKLNQRYERSLFSQFRHGILPLKIETGRFQKLSVEERRCEYCTDNVIEDEMHFICTCSLYTEFRTKLFNRAQESNPLFNGLSVKEKSFKM